MSHTVVSSALGNNAGLSFNIGIRLVKTKPTIKLPPVTCVALSTVINSVTLPRSCRFAERKNLNLVLLDTSELHCGLVFIC